MTTLNDILEKCWWKLNDTERVFLKGQQAELERLRRIEKAIRECPTTSADGIKALIYTTELRDALD